MSQKYAQQKSINSAWSVDFVCGSWCGGLAGIALKGFYFLVNKDKVETKFNLSDMTKKKITIWTIVFVVVVIVAIVGYALTRRPQKQDIVNLGEQSRIPKQESQNIAQHEDGHAVGLGHPDDSCTEETMYRFASEGEIKKRDLHAGDIAGVAKLY